MDEALARDWDCPGKEHVWPTTTTKAKFSNFEFLKFLFFELVFNLLVLGKFTTWVSTPEIGIVFN